jgi:hypothetical protein
LEKKTKNKPALDLDGSVAPKEEPPDVVDETGEQLGWPLPQLFDLIALMEEMSFKNF